MAEKKKITIRPSGDKRVITKVASISAPVVKPIEEVEKAEGTESNRSVEKTERTDGEKTLRVKRTCHFCQSKTNPSYTDLVTLKRFLTDRAKILPKLRSSVCARHQRAVSKHIKYARHLSLLPFVPKV